MRGSDNKLVARSATASECVRNGWREVHDSLSQVSIGTIFTGTHCVIVRTYAYASHPYSNWSAETFPMTVGQRILFSQMILSVIRYILFALPLFPVWYRFLNMVR